MSSKLDTCKRDYKSSRDTRASAEKNIRLKCPYCPRDGLLFTSYGRHIFKEHKELMFLADTSDSKENRKSLFSKGNLKQPMILSSPKGYLSWCFGCQSCFQTHKKAENHFTKWKDCQRVHQENLFALRDQFPLTAAAVPTVLKKKQQLNQFLDDVLERLRHAEQMAKIDPWNFKDEYEEHFEEWGLDLDEEELRKGWKFVLEERPKEPTPPPTPPSEPDEDDVIPLVSERPLTKEEVLQKVLDDPAVSEEDKRALQRDLVPPNGKPQTSAFPKVKRLAKQVEPPPPLETPPPSKKTIEEQLAEIDAFNKKTPWERFVSQHPGMSVQEQLQRASTMGLSPGGSGFKIVGNTKRPTQ
jgi:hypothetical protein